MVDDPRLQDENSGPGWPAPFNVLPFRRDEEQPMLTNEQSISSVIENQLAEQSKQSWLKMLTGAALGFAGLHFFVTQPTARELAQVKSTLHVMEQRVQELTAVGDYVGDTNSLLTNLRIQQAETLDAQRALRAIHDLRSELVEVAAKNDVVSSAIAGMDILQDRIIDQHSKTIGAVQIFDLMASLQNNIIDQRESHESATASLEQLISLKETASAQGKDINQAQASLAQLVGLSDDLQRQSDKMELARTSLTGLASLKAELYAAAENLEAAQNVADKVVSLQGRLAVGEQQAEIAAERAEKLIAINSKLIAGGLNVAASSENLDRMLNIQNKLKSDELNVAASEQNLVSLLNIQGKLASDPSTAAVSEQNLANLLSINEKLAGEQAMIATSEQNLANLLKLESTLADQTGSVAEAIQTIETLRGFRETLNAHIQSLVSIQKELAELGQIEEQLSKVTRATRPLVEVSNPRISDEAQRLAQEVIENRTAALDVEGPASAIDDVIVNESPSEFAEVPLPIEE